MANAVYALWSGESAATLITPALLPFRDDKVRTALLEPLDRAYGPILQSEVDGDQSLPARVEAQRPRLLRARAATLAARAVFFATAPHAGAARGAITGTELRLACAQPGDQIAIFGEALQELASRSAHLYRDGDNYWFSPQPTLAKLAADRARDVSEEQADERLVEVLREEQRGRAGFARVHAVPENLTDVDDRRATVLIVLPPSAPHDASAGPKSKAASLASEALERTSSAQRRFRNALVFAAADTSTIEAARENARRERAWRSIMDDPDIQQNLTQAQTTNAEPEFKRSGEALVQSVRGAWVHILYPEAPDETEQGTGLRTGYEIRSTRLVNRGGAKSVPQAVWDKVSADGTVLKEIGPQNLVQSLEKVWPPEQGHLSIETIRDWVASFVYLPRLRDEATLNNALLQLIENLAYDYAFAASFNENTGVYDDVVDGSTHMSGAFDGGLLVRREEIRASEPEPEPPRPSDEPDPRPDPPPPGGKVEPELTVEDTQPKRFFATIHVDAERAGLEVARIMDGLLVELTRVSGSTIRVSVEIAGDAGNGGYHADVVETVDANARDLKLGEGAWGFESE